MAKKEPKTDRKRPWPDGRKPTAASGLVDNRQFFDSAHAAARLRITQEYLWKLVERGLLTPGKVGEHEGFVFTLADLQRYLRREREVSRETRVLERLQRGDHPVDVYLELAPEGVKLAHVVRVLHHWAKLAGIWVIEGPPGSYARWLERVGLARLRPRDLRRLVEHLLSDPYVAQLAGAWVTQTASERARAPADSPETSARASSSGEPSE